MRLTSASQLVLLPGLLCDARIFAAQVACFPDAVAVDGFGTLRSIADMAVRALAAAPGRIALLGHSMGARVALEAWRLAPERIDRLALVSTGVHLPRAGEAEKRFTLRDLGRSDGAEALVDRWLPPMVAPSRIGDDALNQPLRAMCVDAGVDAYAAQIEALLDRPEAESVLPTIDCPTLVMVGREDAWSPPAQHVAIAAAVPDAELVVVEGVGHMLPAEAPNEFNAAIADWLSRPARHTRTGDR
ncbi:MAG: alpha/beta hydrolase [Sphingomonadales bacterium]